jgi:hypothetical protein
MMVAPVERLIGCKVARLRLVEEIKRIRQEYFNQSLKSLDTVPLCSRTEFSGASWEV